MEARHVCDFCPGLPKFIRWNLPAAEKTVFCLAPEGRRALADPVLSTRRHPSVAALGTQPNEQHTWIYNARHSAGAMRLPKSA